MHKEICEYLGQKCPEAKASATINEVGDSFITVESSAWHQVALALKNGPYEFNVLQVITGTDYLAQAATETTPGQEAHLELSYILASFTKNHELIVKVHLPRGSASDLPRIKSVTDVWKAANWQERECFDMIGVDFENHPDKRRILCPDDWKGHPLRKDYVAEEVYNGMTVYPEAKMNIGEREFGVKQKQDVKGAVTSVNNYSLASSSNN